MKKVFFLIVVSLFSMNLRAQLQFHKDSTFKIVQFTDVHWKPSSPNNQVATDRMNEVLDAEKPDLVVFTGDLIYGRPAADALDAVLQPTVSRNIPFAVVFGNHDDEQDMNREKLLEYISTFKGNLTTSTQGLSGVTNFTLPIKSNDNNRNAFMLYFFDSHSYSKISSVKGYDWIKLNQINWYKNTSKDNTEYNGNKPMPSIAFFHIPLPEYHDAVRNENTPFVGTRREAACSPNVNSGMFTAMLECGDIMATFVGHDHINDYVAYWHGILLAYGRFSGGNTVYNDIYGGNGARVIVLKEGRRSFETWVRIKDHQILNKVTYPDDFIKK